MAVPLLIDTDMGVDDAVAAALAMSSRGVSVRAIVGVGGNVAARQAAANARRLCATLESASARENQGAAAPLRMPVIARGLDQRGDALPTRGGLFGADGFGDADLPAGEHAEAVDFRDAYRQAMRDADGELHIIALGPLTNLAALLDEEPDFCKSVRRVHLTGGAVWTGGDATPHAEFNFRRDPAAAARVLSSGLPISATPLDVTRLVCLDESHAGRLAASGRRVAAALAGMLRCPLGSASEPGIGRAHVADAVTVGGLLWPDLFLKTRMRLEVTAAGAEAGRCKPALGGDAHQRVDLLTAVNAVDFLENLLETLCEEAFVV